MAKRWQFLLIFLLFFLFSSRSFIFADELKLSTIEIKPPTVCILYTYFNIWLIQNIIGGHDYFIDTNDIWLRAGFDRVAFFLPGESITAIGQEGKSWLYKPPGESFCFSIGRDSNTGPSQIWLAKLTSGSTFTSASCFLYVGPVDGHDLIIWTPDLVIGIRSQVAIKLKLTSGSYTEIVGIVDPITHTWNPHSVWIGVVDWDKVYSDTIHCLLWFPILISRYYSTHALPLVPTSVLFSTGLPAGLSITSDLPLGAMWITQPYKKIRATRKQGSVCLGYSGISFSPAISILDVSGQSYLLDSKIAAGRTLFTTFDGKDWFNRWIHLKKKVLRKIWSM